MHLKGVLIFNTLTEAMPDIGMAALIASIAAIDTVEGYLPYRGIPIQRD